MSTIKLAQAIKVGFASRLLKNTSEYKRHKKTLPMLLGALGLAGAGAAGNTVRNMLADSAELKALSDMKANWRNLVDANAAARVQSESARALDDYALQEFSHIDGLRGFSGDL
jgi:hypothetical protein